MLTPGEVYVWRVRLDHLGPRSLPKPTAGELARAAQFRAGEIRERWLRSHQTLRAILSGLTSARLDLAVTEKGKPYLPGAPELRFNLSRSHGMALIAAALGVEIGVDVERRRPVPQSEALAERYFPPSEAAAFAATPEPDRDREFFRRWTRLEAMLKARGVGLYGAGAELVGEWTVQEIAMPEDYAGAVAAMRSGMRVTVSDFGGEA